MKVSVLFSTFVLISNFTLMTCSSEEPVKDIIVQPCVPSEQPFTSMETYFGCKNTKNTMNIALNNTYKIIRSQTQFNQLVTNASNCPVNIDISNYDLIIGKKQLTSGNQSISYEYTGDCINKKLKVTFNQNETMVAPNITYHVLVPKLGNGENLVVETIVK